MKAWLAVLLLVALLGGCKKEASFESAEAPVDAKTEATRLAVAAPPQQPGSPPAAAPSPSVLSRKLIRRVEIQLVVKDTEAAARQLQQMAASMGGFVSDIDASKAGDVLRYQMTLRVPAERLDEAREAIRKIALRVEREQLATEDVTDQYVDLQARLKSLQLTEEELRELLAESRERARKVEEVMAIYRELTGVRTQIEQIQGQLNQLQNLVGFSTIRLILEPDSATKPIVTEGGWRPGETTRNAFRNLVEFLQGVVSFLIVVVINGIPVVLVLLIPVLLFWKAWNRWKKRKPGPSGETPS